jgi:hypothetical protein
MKISLIIETEEQQLIRGINESRSLINNMENLGRFAYDSKEQELNKSFGVNTDRVRLYEGQIKTCLETIILIGKY